MALQERFAGSDSSPSTLLQRVRSAPRRTFWLRLVAWSVFVVGLSLALQRTVTGRVPEPDKGVLTAALAIGVCSGLGMAAYCFARFMLGREVRLLLAAAAFSALSAGSFLQAAIDLRGAEAEPHAWIVSIGWLIAGVLFAGAAHSNTVWRRTNRYETAQHFLLALVAVAAFPLAMLPYALDISLLKGLGLDEHSAFAASVVQSAMGLVSTLLVLSTLLTLLRRFQRISADEGSGEERFFGLLCYFLAPCVVGLVLRSAACERFDVFSFAGEAVLAGAWFALIVRAGFEQAFAQRESADRFDELDTLHQISWSLVGAGTVKELLELFVNTLVEQAGATIAALYHTDNSGENLHLGAMSGSSSASHAVGSEYAINSSGRRPGFHSGHTAEAFKSGTVRIAYGVYIDVELVPWRLIAVDDGAAASFPLVHGGETVGVLSVYFSNRRRLDTQSTKLISTIAAAATPAIEYARSREAQTGPTCDCQAAMCAA